MDLTASTALPGFEAAKAYGKLVLRGSHWEMSAIPPHVAIRLKQVFPKISKTETALFRFQNTLEVCSDLHWFLNRYPMEMSVEDSAWLGKGRGQFERQRASIEEIMLPDWKAPAKYGFKPGYAMYQGQAQAAEMLHKLGRLLNMDDVGLGKTVFALGVIAGSQYLPTAIVIPTHLADQWVRFINKFTYMTAHVIRGTQPYDLPPAHIYIFKYSNIAGWVDIAAQGVFRAVFFDEIHHLRNGVGTAKGRAAKVFVDHAQLRCGMSATPIFNYGSEIFNIIEFLEPGALGAWDEFTREWCRVGPGGKWVVKDPVALGSYLRELQLAVRRIRQGRPINKILVEVDFDEEVEADSLELARRLAQRVVTGSFVERGQAARELDNFSRMVTGVAKAKGVAAYVRMLLKSGKPIILAGWHRDVYDIWLKELSDLNPILYTGSETPKQKDKAKHAFVSGETKLLILSLRSGEGIDGLQAVCSTIVFGELDWSPQIDEQVIGRVDRPGQEEDEITAIYLYTSAGSDPTVISVRGLKASQARGIIDPLRGVETVYSNESRIQTLAKHYLGIEKAAA